LALVIRRALLIANPASRRGLSLLTKATRAFERAGVACDVFLTERAGHAAEIATARHADYDAVFSLGGDGTVMEVAGAFAGTGFAVGALPGGTGNLLARAMSIPLNVNRAVTALLHGREKQIDVGRLGDGRRFAIAAGVGIDALMVMETPRWLKQRFGVLAYALMGTRAALRVIIGGHMINVRLTVDGVTETRMATTIMVANVGSLLSGRLTLGPAIRADDGLLDVCLFAPRNLFDGIGIMWRMLTNNFADHPAMFYRAGTKIRIETDRPCQAQADGELIGLTPLDISVETLSVKLLVPAP
jgi:YegS/Rv2252/BmrU family lipid kinase